jgi:drug/metabolite transporter (DMT)-like permease
VARADPPAAQWPLYAKLTAVVAIWGGTFVAGRMVADDLPHMVTATGRFLVACAMLVGLCYWREGGLPRLTRRQAWLTFWLGVTGITLYNICFLAALERMPASRTALIVAMNPAITSLAAALLFGDRLNPKKVAGIALAFVGAAIVIGKGNPLDLFDDAIGLGELFMLIGVLGWAAYTLISRAALDGLSALGATTWASLWGGGLLLIGALFELDAVRWDALGAQSLAAIFYLGAFGTVIAFIWYAQAIRALGPSRTIIFTNLVPVFGVLFGALLLGEPVLPSMLAGGALVLAGVVLTNRG